VHVTDALAILLYGELDTKAHDRAKKLSDQTMGPVIFNGVLVKGYWAVREQAEGSAGGGKGQETRIIKFECSEMRSTDCLMVYGSAPDWNGECQQLNAQLLSVDPQWPYADGSHGWP
jgi:hypothetical protein